MRVKLAAVLGLAFVLGPACGRLAAQEPETLTVQILDHRVAEDRGRLRGEGLPVLFRGLRPKSLSELQRWIRIAANPEDPENQDPDLPSIEPPSPRYPDGVYPSRRHIVVRCSPGQDMGWVQAVVLCCGLLPWDSRDGQLTDSPLIEDVRISLLSENARDPVSVRRAAARGEDGTQRPMRQVVLNVLPGSRNEPSTSRRVALRVGAYGVNLGTSSGYRTHPTNEDAATLAYAPDSTRTRLRESLSRFWKESPDGQVRITADPRTPFVYVHDLLQIIHGNELAVVLDVEMDRQELQDLMDSVSRGGPAPVTHPQPAQDVGEADAAPGMDATDPADVASAVSRALAWLASTQSPDGSWNADQLEGQAGHDVGVTGLAVLAFIGGGHADRGAVHRETTDKALCYLRNQQDAEGCIGPRALHNFTYNHAVATLALCEAYGITGSETWKQPAQAAVNFCLQAQNPYKGWRYGVRPGDNDTSITSWMVMALKSAQVAGLEINETSLAWALNLIEEMTDDETGRTGYTKRGERPVRVEGRLERFPADLSEALTAAGMMVRIFCGQEVTHPMIKKGAALLLENLPEWNKERGSIDMIYWYFGSLSLYQCGGPSWVRWRAALARDLLAHQEREGTATGSFPPVGAWGSEGGRVYSTALTALTLEICQR